VVTPTRLRPVRALVAVALAFVIVVVPKAVASSDGTAKRDTGGKAGVKWSAERR
jgi:hypothetical protein